MELPLLKDIVIIFALSIAVILFCHRLKIPAIVGFLLTGILAGPHGLGFVKAPEDVETLATIGIVLLLFTVGMEFSLTKIFEYKRYFLIGGTVQVFTIVLAGFIIGLCLGRPIGESIFLGCLLSLSSTAIVLRVLEEKAESDTPHGRLTTGVLIFQDVIAIQMMLLTPMFAGSGALIDQNFILTSSLGFVILAGSLFIAYKIIPKLFYYIAKTRSRELFLLTVLTICFSVAWLTSSIGLSLSLGAFLAGLIISESEYRHEAIGDVLPFQDVFTSFFFVSIGMLLDVNFFLAQPIFIIFIAAAILLLKIFAAGIAALVLGLPLRTAVLTGIALCQIGEFSFVLAKNGFQLGLGNDYLYQLFLAVSLITMGVTPTLIAKSHAIADHILKLPFPDILKTGLYPEDPQNKTTHAGHIVIIGFGPNGRNLAHAAAEAKVPYLILEMNPETVKIEKMNNEPIYFGDATHESVLKHVNIESASIVAVVINDYIASCRIVEVIRKINPEIYIIVRTHYLKQIHAMYQLGANDVIPDEYGSSVEIFTRVMNLFKIPSEQIEKTVNNVRIKSYEKLKSLYSNSSSIYDHKSNDLKIDKDLKNPDPII